MAKQTYQVSFCNSAGPLDSRTVTGNSEDDVGARACEVAIEMLTETGSLHPGDRIIVEEIVER